MKGMKNLSELVRRLCLASQQHHLDPYDGLVYPEALNPEQQDQWFMTPELISLFGTSHYAKMSETERMRLSFYELINFFSLNVHGERHLISGMSFLLYSPLSEDFSSYLHHFLAEENKHMEHFARFCVQYGKKLYPDVLQRGLPKDYQIGEEELLYFVKVVIFEECFDRYNVTMAKDERLPEIVRNINASHHWDESRHLSFGRKIVAELFDQYSQKWQPETLENVRKYVLDYLESFGRDLFNFRVYRDANLSGDPVQIRQAALQSEAGREHFRALTQKTTEFLIETGILLPNKDLHGERKPTNDQEDRSA